MAIIAGTGHRPDKLGGYNNEAFLRLVKVCEEYLKEEKPELVISGVALGFDMALFQAAVNLDIPVLAAVPFEGQESRWSDKVKKYYFNLLSKAKEVVYVCDAGYAAWKMQKRNEYMVNACDKIVACWDGSQGGTGNCVKYASDEGKVIDNIYNSFINNSPK